MLRLSLSPLPHIRQSVGCWRTRIEYNSVIGTVIKLLMSIAELLDFACSACSLGDVSQDGPANGDGRYTFVGKNGGGGLASCLALIVLWKTVSVLVLETLCGSFTLCVGDDFWEEGGRSIGEDRCACNGEGEDSLGKGLLWVGVGTISSPGSDGRIT